MKIYKQVVLSLIIAVSFLGVNVVVADAGQFKLDMIMANRGDPGAQFSVAIAYEDGVGTGKDIKQAFDWYSRAAKQGHAGAQYKTATFYEQGRVVKKDTQAAMEWYKKAAANGSRQAKKRMKTITVSAAASNQKQQPALQEREKQQQEAARTEQERQAAAASETARKGTAKAEQERQAAAAREKARKEAAKVKKPATKVAVAAPPPRKPTPKPKAAPKRVDIPDIMDVVVNNSWKAGSMAADYLPSAVTRCAQTGSEVICFSDERVRIVSGKKVTYTTKATLNNFKRDGTFRVSYVYNAINLAPTNVRGSDKDAHGLRAQEGWQEPQIVVNCQTSDRKNLYCSKGKSRFHYVR